MKTMISCVLITLKGALESALLRWKARLGDRSRDLPKGLQGPMPCQMERSCSQC